MPRDSGVIAGTRRRTSRAGKAGSDDPLRSMVTGSLDTLVHVVQMSMHGGVDVSVFGQGMKRKILSRESDHRRVVQRTVFLGGVWYSYPNRNATMPSASLP